MPTEHFKSPESYRKYRAYVHIHHIPTHAKSVVVGGKRHKVKHSEKKETPEMEAKEHSPKFLKKSAKLSERKIGKGKMREKKTRKSVRRKRA